MKKEMSYEEMRKLSKTFKTKDIEMDKRLGRMANTTWDIIAADCLDDDYGRPDERKTLPRSHVIEIVSDFWYLVNNNRSHLNKVMKSVFSYKRYGY